MEQARTEVAAVYASACRREYKEAYDPAEHYRVAVIPFKEVLGERARLTLWLLMVAAAFVMIISAANVANLTLMRGVRREHELVVRAALGAGVARLRRLLLVENLVLTLMGAVFGVLIAIGGVRLLMSLAARYSPRANEIRLDGVVLGFTLALSVAIALLLSFVGIAAAGREHSLRWISAGVRRMTQGLSKQRLQRGLVVVQIAVSVVLLAGAGLLTRTMIQLSEVATGLKAEEVLTIAVPLLKLSGGPSNGDPAAWYRSILESDAWRRSGTSGCEPRSAACRASSKWGSAPPLPLRASGTQFELKAEGKALAVGEAMPRAEVRTANPEYFRAAGIPLLQGREFSDHGCTSLRQGRDHQPDARRPALPGRGSDREADRVDGRAVEIHVRSAAIGARSSASSATRRMADWTPHPDRSCSCPSRRCCRWVAVLVIRADSNVAGSGDRGNAHRAAHRAHGADRERDDHRADQGSERRAAASECRAHLLVRHSRGDHRRGGDRRRAGVLGERAHERDRHPHEPRRRSRSRAADDPEGRRRAACRSGSC